MKGLQRGFYATIGIGLVLLSGPSRTEAAAAAVSSGGSWYCFYCEFHPSIQCVADPLWGRYFDCEVISGLGCDMGGAHLCPDSFASTSVLADGSLAALDRAEIDDVRGCGGLVVRRGVFPTTQDQMRRTTSHLTI